MRRWAIAAAAVGGLAAALLLQTLPQRSVTPAPPAGRASPSAPPEQVDRPVRDVTPPGATQGPPVSGPLTRVPGPFVAPRPREKPAGRSERLFRPVVTAAGAFRSRQGTVRLDGIAAPEPERRCGTGARAWPCGRMARTALRGFIRGRAIDCEVPPGRTALPESTRCSVGGRDIAAWLVEQGWAEARSDAYRDAEQAARRARRGLWGEPPG